MSIFQTVKNFINDERGVTAIEYAVLGVAISAIMLALFSGETGLGASLQAAFAQIVSQLDDAVTAAQG
ncbi:Flp family type IVb pilin [Enterovibrio baiacu]|uniref:Flp family type IVb pilin n=1 Tax=Enterovibrio baiacu TaxID=2491023 RepID=UPI003D0FA5F3